VREKGDRRVFRPPGHVRAVQTAACGMTCLASRGLPVGPGRPAAVPRPADRPAIRGPGNCAASGQRRVVPPASRKRVPLCQMPPCQVPRRQVPKNRWAHASTLQRGGWGVKRPSMGPLDNGPVPARGHVEGRVGTGPPGGSSRTVADNATVAPGRVRPAGGGGAGAYQGTVRRNGRAPLRVAAKQVPLNRYPPEGGGKQQRQQRGRSPRSPRSSAVRTILPLPARADKQPVAPVAKAEHGVGGRSPRPQGPGAK